MIPFGKWIVSTPTFLFFPSESVSVVCSFANRLQQLVTGRRDICWAAAWTRFKPGQRSLAPGVCFLGGVHSLNGTLTIRQKSVMAFNWKSITGFVSYRTCQSAFSRKSHSAKICYVQALRVFYHRKVTTRNSSPFAILQFKIVTWVFCCCNTVSSWQSQSWYWTCYYGYCYLDHITKNDKIYWAYFIPRTLEN